MLIFCFDFNLGESVVVKRKLIDRTNKRSVEIDIHVTDDQSFITGDGTGFVFARSKEFTIYIQAELCILHITNGYYMMPVTIEIGGRSTFGQRLCHIIIYAEIESSVLVFKAEPRTGITVAIQSVTTLMEQITALRTAT